MEGSNRVGPLTLEELKERNVTGQTMVWFQGLGDWQPAGSVPELKDVLSLEPPEISISKTIDTPVKATINQQPPKTWLTESILVTLLCCMPFGVVGIVNAAKVESRFYAGDIEGANRYSAEAGKWTKVSFWIGILVIVLYVIFVVLTAATGFWHD